MSYLVLARKWRPSQFDEVVGQEHVARTLKNAIEQDRVHHAFLFTGARGVGKTSTARILAKALNCKSGPTSTPCDECISCLEITAGKAVDVFEIDGASNRGINEIRELREGVRYAPSRDKHKIYIIDEVHMLTNEAFNALLKTLEEPPDHAKFIFATTEPQKIPVTILSRCQRYDFKRVSQPDIVQHLLNICESESIEAEKGALQIIARQAAGGMRDALSLLDQIISFSADAITEEQVGEVLGVANRRQLFSLSEAVLGRDAGAALQVLDEVNSYGYDLGQFAAEVVAHFRDLTVIAAVDDPEQVTDLTSSEIATARAQIDSAPVNLLHRYFAVMAEATQELSRSSFPKLIFEMTLVRLTQLEPLVGIDLLVDRLTALEGDFDGEPAPPGETGNPDSPQSARTREQPSPSASARPTNDSTPPANPPAPETAPETPPEPAPAPAPAATPKRTQAPSEPVAVEPDPEPQSETAKPETAPDSTPPIAAAVEPSNDRSDALSATAPAPEEDDTPFLELMPQARWQRVVRWLMEDYRPTAMTAEHAYVDRFADGIVELTFAPKYLDFIQEPERMEALELALETLSGSAWSVKIDATEQVDPGAPRTLAQQRDDEVERRLKLIESELRNHHVVIEARSLFDVEPDAVRVQVKLFDEES